MYLPLQGRLMLRNSWPTKIDSVVFVGLLCHSCYHNYFFLPSWFVCFVLFSLRGREREKGERREREYNAGLVGSWKASGRGKYNQNILYEIF